MIQKPKGTYDVYGKKSKQIKYIEKILNSLMEKYNYEYMRTPLFENMVFTLEPGLETRAGHIGLEEDVVVKKDGAHFIVEPQRELYLIKEE